MTTFVPARRLLHSDSEPILIGPLMVAMVVVE
jgi:hypothetical protein